MSFISVEFHGDVHLRSAKNSLDVRRTFLDCVPSFLKSPFARPPIHDWSFFLTQTNVFFSLVINERTLPKTRPPSPFGQTMKLPLFQLDYPFFSETSSRLHAIYSVRQYLLNVT